MNIIDFGAGFAPFFTFAWLVDWMRGCKNRERAQNAVADESAGRHVCHARSVCLVGLLALLNVKLVAPSKVFIAAMLPLDIASHCPLSNPYKPINH